MMGDVHKENIYSIFLLKGLRSALCPLKGHERFLATPNCAIVWEITREKKANLLPFLGS